MASLKLEKMVQKHGFISEAIPAAANALDPLVPAVHYFHVHPTISRPVETSAARIKKF